LSSKDDSLFVSICLPLSSPLLSFLYPHIIWLSLLLCFCLQLALTAHFSADSQFMSTKLHKCANFNQRQSYFFTTAPDFPTASPILPTGAPSSPSVDLHSLLLDLHPN
jgi:hypothetical protein